MSFIRRILARVPMIRQTDHRSVASVIENPRVRFYNPDALDYGNAQLPTVPGTGGYVSCGCAMVLVTDNNLWNRQDVSLVGPVREFFAAQQYDMGTVKQA